MFKRILSFTSVTSIALALSIDSALAMRIHLSAPQPSLPDYLFWSLIAFMVLVACLILFLAITMPLHEKCPECGQSKPVTKKVADRGKGVPAKS